MKKGMGKRGVEGRIKEETEGGVECGGAMAGGEERESGGENKGKQVRDFEAAEERRGWRERGRTSGTGRAAAAQHPSSLIQPVRVEL